MNTKLSNLYNEAMKKSFQTLDGLPSNADGGPANPQLIRVPDDYETSKLKVAYFGQETNGWEGPFAETKGVDHLQQVYHDFVNIKSFEYGGQYWNGVKSFQNAFLELDSSSRFTANNLVKIGKAWDRGSPPESVIDWQSHWFEVIREELKILKPDVIIFLSGPNYDRHIETIFGKVTFEAVNARPARELSRVVAEGLPRNSFRTYHPNYGYRNNFYPTQSDILDEVKR
ncbi:hypothetical protein [Prosthecobacter sp.]|uniref:hypothetical protein n=1 Tax=Prosthecobacter sp. TaxID=1965333 RepID=UPI0037834C3E